ncbi:MAG: ATP-binding protein [Nitrosomonas sp.]|nr:ATP-binding protein [Nitrosomonas sp.]MDP1951182.1 ATP-binding protein [Nitrosomonas sp.]
MPLLLAVEQVYAKIRNLKYRYIRDDTLFPDEVDQYDPYIIREALHNCIAHQDYTLGGGIIVVETEDATLAFLNSGEFIPKSVQHVIDSDTPEQRYRNRFLVDAMVNLKMIDTIGSGIKRIFRIQRERFFPLPDYDLSNNKVKVKITGKVLDQRYARKLAQMPNLSLHEIILLDKIQKAQPLEKPDLALLRKNGLIEGRKPNLHISSSVAKQANLQKDYIEMRGLDDKYYQSLVVEYLKRFKQAKRSDIEELLLDKLPKILDEEQKQHKIKNLLQKLRKQGVIQVDGKNWSIPK